VHKKEHMLITKLATQVYSRISFQKIEINQSYAPLKCVLPKIYNNKYYLSYIITVSAVARFIPNHHARVESIKENLIELGALNRSIRICLSTPLIVPSILS